MSLPDDYSLQLNRRQALIVSEALDLYSRIHLGQFREVVRPEWWNRDGKSSAETFLMQARAALFPDLGTYVGASYGITQREEVHDAARISFDLYHAICHRLAWDRNPSGSIQVDYDPIRPLGEEPVKVLQGKGSCPCPDDRCQ